MKIAMAVAAAIVLALAGGANGKDRRDGSGVRTAPQRAVPMSPYQLELLRSPDRSDIYGSDAGGRHWYTNPDRDPFGPNPNCGYKNC
jgi:hypothetical protein